MADYKCTRCEKTKPISEFPKNNTERGHRLQCKLCVYPDFHKERPCVICGMKFFGRGNSKTCSVSCSNINAKNYKTEYNKNRPPRPLLVVTKVKCGPETHAPNKKTIAEQATARALSRKIKPANIGPMNVSQIIRQWNQICEGAGL